ncbi:hypothetical protein DSTSK_27700 [Desulforhabdus sp. TSK]|nr:hypothetical protein DSTSK_27700 [Desulforhabdus sp. TSK]
MPPFAAAQRALVPHHEQGSPGMSTEAKKAAVRQYLESEFSGFAVEGGREASDGIHRFTISQGDSTHYALIAEEFLESHSLEEIGEKLRNFLLAEHLKEMSTTPVLVTNIGLSLEYD